MAWIESHQSLGNHRKLLRLASLLNVSDAAAIGHLQFLWWWGLDNADIYGAIGNMAAQEIAEVMHWRGDADRLKSSLIEAGWLDQSDTGVFLHDWYEYTGKLQETRMLGRKQRRAGGLSRMAQLSLSERKQLAQKAAASRWNASRNASLQLASGDASMPADASKGMPADASKGMRTMPGEESKNSLKMPAYASSTSHNMPATVPNRTVPNTSSSATIGDQKKFSEENKASPKTRKEPGLDNDRVDRSEADHKTPIGQPGLDNQNGVGGSEACHPVAELPAEPGLDNAGNGGEAEGISVLPGAEATDRAKTQILFDQNNCVGRSEAGRIGDQNLATIVACYEQNISLLTPTIAEDLKDLATCYSAEWFTAAVKEACSLNARNLKYVTSILTRWQVEGFKSPRKGVTSGEGRGHTQKRRAYTAEDYRRDNEMEL